MDLANDHADARRPPHNPSCAGLRARRSVRTSKLGGGPRLHRDRGSLARTLPDLALQTSSSVRPSSHRTEP